MSSGRGRCAVRFSLMLAASFCALAACKEVAGPNECTQNADCSRGLHCSEESAVCFAPKTAAPYTLVLQVSRLPSGEGRISRFTMPARQLLSSDESFDLDVPRAVYVTGQVRGRVQNGEARGTEVLINAELAFTPSEKLAGLPAATVVVESRGYAKLELDNFKAALAPNTRYFVRAIPLGEEASRLFPPYETEIVTTEHDLELDLIYDDLSAVEATLVDQSGMPRGGVRVRIVDRASNRVLSSTAITDSKGRFEVTAGRELLTSSGYAFEVDLSPSEPFRSRVRIDPSYLDAATHELSMPTIPNSVLFRGRVEQRGSAGTSAQANLVLHSRFPVPVTAGNVGDRNFCRSAILGDTRPAFECEATVQGTSGEDGLFAISLLPGDYDVYLSPIADPQYQERVTTAAGHAVVETQPNGRAQLGQIFTLPKGALYRGQVRDHLGNALPNVIVRAEALQLVGYLGEVAAYNRSTETVSDDDGNFQLAVDVGFYDLVARPSDAYPWMYVPNRAISRGAGTIDISGFVLHPPILLEGKVETAGQIATNAEIDAYAVIGNLAGGKRSVLIGRTTSREDGRYTLLLPFEIVSLESEAGK